MQDRIYLVGLPGSGKTTLGKRLAKKIGYHFVDMDEMIEMHEEKSITEIFEHKGEAYFREVEHKILLTTQALSKVVIATGGGAPCFFNNAEIINKSGLSIFINVSPEEIVKRISRRSQQDRPLLKDKNLNDLLEELKIKHKQRLPYYNKANHTLEGDQLNEVDLYHALKV